MTVTAQFSRVVDLAENDNFRRKVAVALIDQVSVVAGELVTIPNHPARLSFAAQVAYRPMEWATKMAIGVIVVSAGIQAALTNAQSDTNAAAVLDADIRAAVTVVWDFYSNAVLALAPTDTKVL